MEEIGGLGPSEVRRLKQLEEEHAEFKKLARLSLDKVMCKDAPLKKALKPSRKRLLINELRDR